MIHNSRVAEVLGVHCLMGWRGAHSTEALLIREDRLDASREQSGRLPSDQGHMQYSCRGSIGAERPLLVTHSSMGRNKTRTIVKGPVQVEAIRRVNKRNIVTHTHVPVPTTPSSKQRIVGIPKTPRKPAPKSNNQHKIIEEYDPIQMMPLDEVRNHSKVYTVMSVTTVSKRLF